MIQSSNKGDSQMQ